MRTLWIIATLWAASANMTPSKASVEEKRAFETNGYGCVVEVVAMNLPTGEPDETVRIRCEGKLLLQNDLHDAEVKNIDLFGQSTGPVRAIVTWERGTGAGITVIVVDSSRSGPSATLSFDHFSRLGGESFESGDILLANVGARLRDVDILPASTNVYRWNGKEYEFQEAFTWKKDASWNDRYCILSHAEYCPAVRSIKPALEAD